MSSLGNGTTIGSFEQLRAGLQAWTSFDDPGMYSAAEMMALLRACVENLRNNVLATEVLRLGDELTEDQRSFLMTLVGL